MKNSQLRRILMLASCAVLLVCLSVGATLAFLTSQTGVVTNTFVVGNVIITLDEAPVNTDGQATAGDRVYENEYHLFPDHEYDKDPTVHVDTNSEDCWLFVQVVNGITDIEDGVEFTETTTGEDGTETTTTTKRTIAQQMEANGWTRVEGATNVYAYKEIVSRGANVVVFEKFKILSTVVGTELANYADATVTIQAYAIQADGFNTAEDAWAEAPLAAWQPATGE